MLAITTIATHRLADGGFTEITRVGRKYQVMRGFSEWLVAPEITGDLNLNQARALFSDYVRADLFETDD